jgi:anti-anti-sigma factor
LEGSIHYVVARSLRAFGDELAGRVHDRTFVIDLTAVTVIDSTGMGILARLGRKTLERGRRSVMVCPDNDLGICLRSAAFDKLFLLLETSPLDEAVELKEVRLDTENMIPEALELVMLDAHRDLSDLSDRNQRAFADVVSLLDAQRAKR